MTTAIGIDIGGTNIKAARIDTRTGALVSDRIAVPTPQPATPQAVAGAVADTIVALGADPEASGACPCVGVAVPAVVQHGITRTAANIDRSWIGANAVTVFERTLGRPVAMLNDADAAGIAEASFGAAHAVPGVVMVVTLGTGIGSALLIDGRLVPNTELGHLCHGDVDMCFWACAKAMTREGLTWTEWAARLQVFLARAEELIWPDLFVIGGEISREADTFLPMVTLQTPVVPALLGNDSGIIGAAMAAVGPTDVKTKRDNPHTPDRG